MAKSHGQKTKQGKMTFPQRGEIYLVRFDPTVGHEIQETRPAVIIQNDISNRSIGPMPELLLPLQDFLLL